MERASETLCQAEPPQVTLATEHVPARVVSAVAPVQSLLPTSPKAGPPSATSITADNAMPAHFSERTTDLNPSVWTSVQQTKDHNRALPVAEWSAVRAAGNLENIVKVQGVKEIIKQTCCVCVDSGLLQRMGFASTFVMRTLTSGNRMSPPLSTEPSCGPSQHFPLVHCVLLW